MRPLSGTNEKTAKAGRCEMKTTKIDTREMDNVYFADEAECVGRGSMKWKYVRFLSQFHRDAIAGGALVLVESNTDYGMIDYDGKIYKRVILDISGRSRHRCGL